MDSVLQHSIGVTGLIGNDHKRDIGRLPHVVVIDLGGCNLKPWRSCASNGLRQERFP